VDTILGDDYAYIVKLYGVEATLAKLIATLKRQGAQASIKRIDLIVMLHGNTGKLIFHSGSEKSSVVKDQIKALNLGTKLRPVYSTSCFGDSHSADFIAAGFDPAIGSKKVNANAAVEFGPLLGLWQFDCKLSDCLAPHSCPLLPQTPPQRFMVRLQTQVGRTTWIAPRRG
jgi:hypothetical protein